MQAVPALFPFWISRGTCCGNPLWSNREYFITVSHLACVNNTSTVVNLVSDVVMNVVSDVVINQRIWWS